MQQGQGKVSDSCMKDNIIKQSSLPWVGTFSLTHPDFMFENSFKHNVPPCMEQKPNFSLWALSPPSAVF